MVAFRLAFLFVCVARATQTRLDANATEVLDQTAVIQKVIDLLTELKGRLEKDAVSDRFAYAKYENSAKNEIGTAERIIDEKTDAIAGLDADLERLAATITTSQQALEKAGNELAKADKELSDATAVRADEKKTFQGNEQKLVEANDQLNRAIATLKKVMGLSQQASSPHKDTKMLQEKSETVASVAKHLRSIMFEGKDFSLSYTQREMIDSFVARAQDMAPARLRKASGPAQDAAPSFLQVADSQQGSGDYGAYTSQSGGVTGVLESALTKSEGELDTLRSKEKSAKDTFDMLKKGLEGAISTQKEAQNTNKLAISKAQQDTGKAEASKLAEKEVLAQTKTTLADVKAELAEKNSSYVARKSLRADEVTAVDEAKQVLTDPKMQEIMNKYEGASFIQIRQTKSSAKLVDVRPLTALSFLETRRVRSHNIASSTDDPFAKIKTLISEMLDKLQGEQNKDAEKHAFCEKEMGDTSHELEEKQAWVKKYKSQIEVMDAELNELDEGIHEAERNLNDVNKLMSDAQTVRGQESGEAKTAMQDYSSAKTLLKNAVAILTKIYGAEGKSTVADASEKNEESTSSMGGGVIGILEIAVDNYDQLYKETDLAEKKAAKDYTELTNSRKVQAVTFQTDLDNRRNMETKLLGDKMRAEKDHDNYAKQATALEKVMDTLKKSCTYKVDTYAERKQRREAELKGLQDALKSLEGEEVS